jgi:glycosyltransferase involved in cell wall biosynthesis
MTICMPMVNEEQNIEPLYAVMEQVSDRYDFELVFTVNHSTDRGFEILEQLARSDSRIEAIRFSRNFGFQRSIFTLTRGETRKFKSIAICRIPPR